MSYKYFVRMIFESRARRTSLAFACLFCSGINLANGAVLKGSFSPIPSGTEINLTVAGNADWVHWGLYTETSLNRKIGVTPQISNFKLLSGPGAEGYVYSYQLSDNSNGYSWTDGTPTARLTNTTTGVWAYGNPQEGTGFELTVPADTTVRTIRIYVGTFAAEGLFYASLSDSSADDYIDGSLYSRYAKTGLYSLEYAANSSGQTLTIRWTLSRSHSSIGNVSLHGAALTTTNDNPPFVSIRTPSQNKSFDVGTDINIEADASDLDGTISKVEFYDGNNKFCTVTSSPYSCVWSNNDAGYHVLTAVATDQNSNFSSSVPVEIFLNKSGGTLFSAKSLPPANVDLALEGTADWVHWGLINTNFNRKAGLSPQISELSLVGSNLLERYTDNLTAYSWTNGTPTPGATNSTTGVFITGLGNGFQISAPADRNLRRLKVYVGLYGAQGIFRAHLSDFSAPAFSDISLSNVYDNDYAVYTLDYAAASDGQTLRIDFRSLALFDQQFGNVTLQAATLVGTPAGPTDIPPVVTISAPTNGASFMAPANITISAAASATNQTVTSVEIYNGTTKLAQSNTNTCSVVWTNVVSGPYSLTARATDSLGISTMSVPVEITVLTGANLELQHQLFTTNGALGLRIFPKVAQPYSLEASSNLTYWYSIFTNQTGASASNFVQTPIPDSPRHFFRAKKWP